MTLAAVAGASIKGVSGIASVTKDVLSMVRERDVVLQVENLTDLELTFLWDYHSSGRYETGPDKIIKPDEASVFSSENRTGNAEGAVGSAVYQIGKTDWRLCIYYSEPAIGTRKSAAMIVNGAWHHEFRDHGASGAEVAYDNFDGGSWANAVTESSNSFSDPRCAGASTVTYSTGETTKFTLTK